MSETVAIHSPQDHRLPSRVVAFGAALALAIVAVITLVLLVAASSSGESPGGIVPTVVPQAPSANPDNDTCVRSGQVTLC